MRMVAVDAGTTKTTPEVAASPATTAMSDGTLALGLPRPAQRQDYGSDQTGVLRNMNLANPSLSGSLFTGATGVLLDL